MTGIVRNFGHNVAFTPGCRYQPGTIDELLQIMRRHPDQRFRAIGSLHAWSESAATTGVMIDVSRLDSIEITDRGTAVVGSGCQIKRLLTRLARHGLTLPSVGLIDEQTIAGATATGTHGSGKHSLSHYIRAVTIAHFDSSGNPVITRIDQGQELRAARCSLGLMGIIVAIEVQCRSPYRVLEYARAHDDLPSVLMSEKDTPLQQFYLMPWSWQWFGHHRSESDQPRSRLAGIYRLYNFAVIDLGLHLIIFLLVKLLPSRSLIRSFYRRLLPLTIVRDWQVVDDSHAMLVMQHELFRHIEIEVFVQRPQLTAALDYLIDCLQIFGGESRDIPPATTERLKRIGRLDELRRGQGVYCHHYPICMRRVLSDDTMISMAAPSAGHDAENDADWYAISLISYDWPRDRQGFYEFAQFIGGSMAELFQGRCHWGKYHPLDARANERLYPEMRQFREIVARFDPAGHFRNEWLTHSVGRKLPYEATTTVSK